MHSIPRRRALFASTVGRLLSRVVSLFSCISRLAPSVTGVCILARFVRRTKKKREAARSLVKWNFLHPWSVIIIFFRSWIVPMTPHPSSHLYDPLRSHQVLKKYQEKWFDLCQLSTHVFKTRTVTGSELFSLSTFPHTTTFTLLCIFSPLEMCSKTLRAASLDNIEPFSSTFFISEGG